VVSEQQISKELVARNWSFTDFQALDRLNARLKELKISPDQLLQLIEANNELKEPDFRAAAFDLLELKKRTGKNSSEAEVYIKGLDSQIVAREKQDLDWSAKIEKTKGEFNDWAQQCNEEKARFESEQTQNKRILKEDRENLNRELSINKEVRGNIEVTIGLKAELKKIGLDLPTFKSIVNQTIKKGGLNLDIAQKIKESIDKLGSLDKAIAEREKEEKARKQAIANLSAEEAAKGETLGTFDVKIAANLQTLSQQDQQIGAKSKLLASYDERIEKSKWQYEFFELLVSMLLNSPSAAESAADLGVAGFRDAPLAALGLKIQNLAKQGWIHSTKSTPAQRRAAFVVSVMGEYLHSVHCGNCGASFIVNKAHNAYNQWRSSYYCPVCTFSIYTKPDDTFLNLMASPEVARKFRYTRNVLDLTGTTGFKVVGQWLHLLYLLPEEVHKALSEGRRIEVKVLDGTD
jgi:hypothetical protein